MRGGEPKKEVRDRKNKTNTKNLGIILFLNDYIKRFEVNITCAFDFTNLHVFFFWKSKMK